MNNCEYLERRRLDVAMETEKALAEAKNELKEMKKEIVFANNSKKDLELTLYGLKE